MARLSLFRRHEVSEQTSASKASQPASDADLDVDAADEYQSLN